MTKPNPNPHGRTDWTPFDDLLRRGYSDGRSATELQAEVNKALAVLGRRVSRNAVIGRIHRLGLTGGVKTAKASAPRAVRPPARSHKATPKPSPPRPLAPPRRSEPQQEWARGGRPPPDLPGGPAPTPLPPERPGLILVSERDHTARMCCWPIGDPRDADFRRCGVECEPDAKGRRLCPEHRAIAFKPTPPPKAKRQARDLIRMAGRYA